MTSLASAIRMSNIDPQRELHCLVIDKKRVEPPAAIEMENSDNNSSEVSGDSAYWKQKFDEVCELNRATERDLAALQAANLRKETALNAYIALLEKRNGTDSSAHASVVSEIDELRCKLNLYEKLTSISMAVQSDQTVTCVMKNVSRKLITRFDLRIGDSSDLANTDIHFSPTGNVHLLPEYLQENLSMDEEHAPLLLTHIMQKIFDENH